MKYIATKDQEAYANSFFVASKTLESNIEDIVDDDEDSFINRAKTYQAVFRNNVEKTYNKLMEGNDLRYFLRDNKDKLSTKMSMSATKKNVAENITDILGYLSFKREKDYLYSDGLDIIKETLFDKRNMMSEYVRILNVLIEKKWYSETGKNVTPVNLASMYFALYIDAYLDEDKEGMEEYINKLKGFASLGEVEIDGSIMLETNKIMKPHDDFKIELEGSLKLEEHAKEYLEKYFPPLNVQEEADYYSRVENAYFVERHEDYAAMVKNSGIMAYISAYMSTYLSTHEINDEQERMDNLWAATCIFELLLAKSFYSDEFADEMNEKNLEIFKRIYKKHKIAQSYYEGAMEIVADDESTSDKESLALVLAVLVAMDDKGVAEDMELAVEEIAGYPVKEFGEHNKEQIMKWNEIMTWDNPLMVADLAYSFVFAYLTSPVYVASNAAFVNYVYFVVEALMEDDSDDYEEL